MNMTRSELATHIQEKVIVVTEYETGKATRVNKAILLKMEKVLKVKLTSLVQ
jgi:ribosome-binding protein aMBF1 (putative translation factor)